MQQFIVNLNSYKPLEADQTTRARLPGCCVPYRGYKDAPCLDQSWRICRFPFRCFCILERNLFCRRSCWAFAVIASIIVAAYFVVTAYKWYARNPIVTVSF